MLRTFAVASIDGRASPRVSESPHARGAGVERRSIQLGGYETGCNVDRETDDRHIERERDNFVDDHDATDAGLRCRHIRGLVGRRDRDGKVSEIPERRHVCSRKQKRTTCGRSAIK